MDNIDRERCESESNKKINPYWGHKIKCIQCGDTWYIRPPPVDEDGPIGLLFKEYCNTFKCYKCNGFSCTVL